jgi:hypothetical protein
MEFRQHCCNEFVDLEMAFSHGLDINGSATVTMVEMREFCHDMEFTRDSRILFKALDYHRRGFIVNDDIMFLASWNTEQHGPERFNISRARKTINERRQHREKIASQSLASSRDSAAVSRSSGFGTRQESVQPHNSIKGIDKEVSWSYGTSVSTEPIVGADRVFGITKRDIARVANHQRSPKMVTELDYYVLKRQATHQSPHGHTEVVGIMGGFSGPGTPQRGARPQTVA